MCNLNLALTLFLFFMAEQSIWFEKTSYVSVLVALYFLIAFDYGCVCFFNFDVLITSEKVLALLKLELKMCTASARGNVVGILLTLYPVLEPLFVLSCVTSYREAIKMYLGVLKYT
ncbi:unnamed protein product [Nippostrongylus brasiliensis]|uniref:Ion_trans domain-containing protein n=1 Tax=Nippostrongylus brasiliensis TaxID=27835 RepID=A0A0N4Y6K7_NIPBR|nr:unnamed protein product [Nippostrongylus brasiliensis]